MAAGYRLTRETSIPTGADEHYGVKLVVTVSSVVGESSSDAGAEEVAAPQNSSSDGLGGALPSDESSSVALSSSSSGGGGGESEDDLGETNGAAGSSSSSSSRPGDGASEDEPDEPIGPSLGSSSSLSSSSSALEDDNAIFLFSRGTTAAKDAFLGVCSPRDLAVWPVGRSDQKDFYRLARVELTFRAEAVLEAAWKSLVSDVTALHNANTALALIALGEAVSYEFTENKICAVLNSSSSSGQGVNVFNLTLSPVVPYPDVDPVGYRLLVTCTSECSDPKIFLHRDDQPDRDGDVHVRPIAVCSTGDLVDYPTDIPDDEQFPAFYRTSDFDIVAADPILLADVWERIKVDTELLAAALYTHENVVTETLVEDVPV